MLFRRDNNHRDQVDQDAGNAAGDKEDEEQQAEPECADAKEFGKPTAHTRDDPVTAGTS